MNYKVLYDNEWLQLRQKEDGYVYSHEKRCGGAIIAFLIYATDIEKVVVRKEVVPPWGDQPQLCSFTGGVEGDEDSLEALYRELEEEAGVPPEEADVWDLGTIRAGKSNDTQYYLFWIECDSKWIKTRTSGDGTEYESSAENIFLEERQIYTHVQDSLALAILSRTESRDN